VSLWSLICVYLCVICRVTADACDETFSLNHFEPLDIFTDAKACKDYCATLSACQFWFFQLSNGFCYGCSKDEDWDASTDICDVEGNCVWGSVDCELNSASPTEAPTREPTADPTTAEPTENACVENRGGCWDLGGSSDVAGADACKDYCATVSGCAFWFFDPSSPKGPNQCHACSKDENWVLSRQLSWCDVEGNCLWGPVDCEAPTREPTVDPTTVDPTTAPEFTDFIECDVPRTGEIADGALYFSFENTIERDVSFSVCFSEDAIALDLFDADNNVIWAPTQDNHCYGECENFSVFGEDCSDWIFTFTMAALDIGQYTLHFVNYHRDGGNYDMRVTCDGD